MQCAKQLSSGEVKLQTDRQWTMCYHLIELRAHVCSWAKISKFCWSLDWGSSKLIKEYSYKANLPWTNKSPMDHIAHLNRSSYIQVWGKIAWNYQHLIISSHCTGYIWFHHLDVGMKLLWLAPWFRYFFSEVIKFII